MSTSSSNRNRWIPAAPKAPLRRAVEFLQRTDVWVRIGMCLVATTILFVITNGWNSPFKYRLRQAPLRNLHARTTFEFPDFRATEEERNRVRRNFVCFYENDAQLLDELRNGLINDLFKVTQNDFQEVQKTGVWSKFYLPGEQGDSESLATPESFEAFRTALSGDNELEKLREAIRESFIDIDRNGLLEGLEHDIGQGNLQTIEVFPKGDFSGRVRVNVSDVRIAEIYDDLQSRLQEKISAHSSLFSDPQLIADRLFEWLKPRLPVTLTWDEKRSRDESEKAADAVEPIMKTIAPGDPLESDRRNYDSRVIKSQVALDDEDISLLRAEYDALVASESVGTKLIRSFFFFGLFAGMFLLITQYLYFRDHDLLANVGKFGILLALMTVTFIVAWVLALNDEWRSEIVPIVLFSMTVAIAYHIELALLLGASVAFAFSVAHGYGLAEFVVLAAASSASAMMCRSIRSRTKLVNIGMIVAAVVFPTAVGVHYMLGQPLGWALTTDALWFAGGAGIAGLIMTALLPFLERWFDIQTDISLLELSDANHPLLKELVQRAPGTYNHSINVASMSEAAADAIGANGLLCRVGAYFHDVGKLRKPEYFIENQAGGVNKHDDLVPTMSTLVIIAHVKDGAEIARKHRLPRRIIDLIEQHHGTTLVEYFYRRAAKQQVDQGDDEHTIDEADFRYPGPKPQTPEAAVMMLSDAVESASRALRDPAPARIEGLVGDIAKKKFDDGQFDECQITIEQLHTIEESLVKSLNAMYHARVKYPEPQPA